MTFHPPRGSAGAGDPFSALCAAWTEAVTRPWQGGLASPEALAGRGAADPLAAFRAIVDLQRDLMRGWLSLAALPFAALGGAPPPAPESGRPTGAPLPPRPAPAAKPAPAAPGVAQPLPGAAARPVPPAPPAREVAPPLPLEPRVAARPDRAPAARAAPAAPTIDPAGLFSDDTVEKAPPPMLAAAAGAADDLQAIKGIGAKLSRLLNDLGIYHYRQIAAWTPGEIAWINAKIDFKGRVQREKWVAQARALAKAG